MHRHQCQMRRIIRPGNADHPTAFFNVGGRLLVTLQQQGIMIKAYEPIFHPLPGDIGDTGNSTTLSVLLVVCSLRTCCQLLRTNLDTMQLELGEIDLPIAITIHVLKCLPHQAAVSSRQRTPFLSCFSRPIYCPSKQHCEREVCPCCM